MGWQDLRLQLLTHPPEAEKLFKQLKEKGVTLEAAANSAVLPKDNPGSQPGLVGSRNTPLIGTNVPNTNTIPSQSAEDKARRPVVKAAKLNKGFKWCPSPKSHRRAAQSVARHPYCLICSPISTLNFSRRSLWARPPHGSRKRPTGRAGIKIARLGRNQLDAPSG